MSCAPSLYAEMLNEPPYVNLPGVDKPPEHGAKSARELIRLRSRDPRLQKWHEYKAAVPNFRRKVNLQWPDSVVDWADEVEEELIENGTDFGDGGAVEWLYDNDQDFKHAADEGFAFQRQETVDWNRKRLFWVLNRAAWMSVWAVRISRKKRSKRVRGE